MSDELDLINPTVPQRPPTTLQQHYEGLTDFGAWLFEMGHLETNPLDEVPIPKPARRSPADKRGFGPIPDLTAAFVAELDEMAKAAAYFAQVAPVVFDATTAPARPQSAGHIEPG